MLTLSNGSKLPCKCEVMGQEARSQGLATFTTSPNSGVIPAKGTLDVEVTLQASRLGRIQLPLQIKVCCISCLTRARNQGCLWCLSQQSNTSAAPASGCVVSLKYFAQHAGPTGVTHAVCKPSTRLHFNVKKLCLKHRTLHPVHTVQCRFLDAMCHRCWVAGEGRLSAS